MSSSVAAQRPPDAEEETEEGCLMTIQLKNEAFGFCPSLYLLLIHGFVLPVGDIDDLEFKNTTCMRAVLEKSTPRAPF